MLTAPLNLIFYQSLAALLILRFGDIVCHKKQAKPAKWCFWQRQKNMHYFSERTHFWGISNMLIVFLELAEMENNH